MNNKKWINHKIWKTISIHTYVDIDTGEIITEEEFKQNFRKLKTNKKTEYGKITKWRKYEHECRRNEKQCSLW